MNSIAQIQQAFISRVVALFSLSAEQQRHVAVEINDDPKKQAFGDLSTNVALLIAKQLGEQPRGVAQKIIQEFTHPAIARAEIAGPGFINFFLTPAAMAALAREVFAENDAFFALEPSVPRASYNVEFVSANPTGPLHLGHGRNGILGDVYSNVLRFLGHTVIKEFYINDAGAQMQKLGTCLMIRCQQQMGVPAEIPEDGYQGEYLVDLAQQLIAGDKAVVETQIGAHNIEFFTLYARDQLLAQQKKTLDAYGIRFDVWFSEKMLHIDGAVEQALIYLEQKNYTYVEEGALWFKSTAFGDDKDRVLKRGNGEVTYMAADVAYTQNKVARGAQKVIIVVGQDHHGYVARMKAVMQALGHKAEDLDLLLYQLVTIKEGGEALRMSKRAGRIVSLEDIIATVGADVARFFYLHRKSDAHLVFDLDLALKRTEENPVYYVQYAYVRTSSMFEKANEHNVLRSITAADIVDLDEQEALLLKKIYALKPLLENISNNYQTHLLTYYVLEVAHLFHSYYGSHKVIDLGAVATSRKRLALVMLVRNTLQLCMKLLGISCPETM